MSLFDLPKSNTISTSQLRLALVARKVEISNIFMQFPNVVGEEFYHSSLREIDAFLLFIDGSKTVTAMLDYGNTAIHFTIEELQEKVKDLPGGGYFRRHGDELWYYFVCDDNSVIDKFYETLDLLVDGRWQSLSYIDLPENLDLIGQELRYLVLA